MEEKFNKILAEAWSLNVRMRNTLIDFIGDKTYMLDDLNDEIPVYIYDDDSNVHERIVLGIRLNAKQDDVELLLSPSDKEDDDAKWFAVHGGDVVINQTLYNLCDGLVEYLYRKGKQEEQ